MKCFVSFVCFLSVFVLMVRSAPLLPGGSFGGSASLQLGGATGGSASGGGGANANPLTDVLSNIDLPGLLRGVNSFVKLVGVFCPPLSQVLDNVIQNVTSTAFRVFGRLILQNGGLGGSGGGGGSGEQTVSVVLPTFPPDEDEDYEDEEGDEASPSSSSSSSSSFDAAAVSRSGFTTESPGGTGAVALSFDDASESSTTTTTTTGDLESSTSNRFSLGIPTESAEIAVGDIVGPTTTETSKNALFTSPANDESNLIAKRHVRVTREAEDDQDGAESAPQPSDDLTNVDVDDQDRNKRFLPFGGSAEGHASGGGSGNFLFDIIRLVAGSGATEETDEKGIAPGGVAEVDIQKSIDGSTEGIPGPITRLFVIANRGIANLVQDLILRLAQTSERLVNFKARLITSLI